MLAEMAELGYRQVELSHGIRISLVPGILRALADKVVEVSSIHNFCPLPSGVQQAAPNFYQPSAPRTGERQLWLNYSKKTLDFAREVKAQRVVFHSGSAWFFWGHPDERLERLEKEFMSRENADYALIGDDPAYALAREAVLRKVRRKAKKMQPRVAAGLTLLVEQARLAGVRIGVENREGILEFPLDRGMADFLESLGNPDVFGYWHDSGHAQLKEMMGVMPHQELLEANQARLVGFHLHDVSREGRDHQAPGSGVVDLKMVARYFRPEAPIVLELSPRVPAPVVRDARKLVEDLAG